MSERPKVGDRVVVHYEGVVAEDDHSTLPFRVKADGRDESGWVWVYEDVVEVIPTEEPVRSDTAIERRLVALEQEKRESHYRIGELEVEVTRLKEQMANLRSLFHDAGQV